MQVLKLDHADFSLTVECNSIRETFVKAKAKQPHLESATVYRIGNATEASVIHPLSEKWVRTSNTPIHPVFFENKEYFFWIEFKEPDRILNASVVSHLKEIEGKFHFRKSAGVLAGSVNFRNDIGRTELVITYERDKKPEHFTFACDVYPIKLDYRSDYQQILRDIQERYPLLVLDYLRKTYQSFHRGSADNTDLIWWQIFGGIFEEFILAAKYILEKPRISLQKVTRYVRAEQIVHLTPHLEEEFSLNRHLPHKQYRVQHAQGTTDTLENQFFKYVVFYARDRYREISRIIRTKYSKRLSQSFLAEMDKTEKQLLVLCAHPFFRSIGEFRGLRQESLVLQRATGYSTIYRSWSMLKSGMQFLDGVQKLELKNIAELYQIWCFLEMESMLEKLIGKKPESVSLAQLKVDNFVFEFKRGQRSRVLFKTDNGDEVTLYHDYQFGKTGTGQIRSYTVDQRPDIVLQITRNELRDKYDFTYLFDAKYRLQSDEDINKPDYPPEDAINQMHRYRDAIYYSHKKSGKPEKEVIGAYVLFPGQGNPESVRTRRFFTSIEQVNIGAFPLRPNDSSNSELLQEHLRSLILTSSEGIFGEIIPHKGNIYESANPLVLIGIVRSGHQSDYFETDHNLVYHTGKFSGDGIQDFLSLSSRIKYFAPNISGKGVSVYYEIADICIQRRCTIFQEGHKLHRPDDVSERIVFKLGNKHCIRENMHFQVNTVPYAYSTLAAIRNPIESGIQLINI